MYRLYRKAGLSLRLKRPRRNKAARWRQPKQFVPAINEIWSMDSVADALFDGRKLRKLTVVDNHTRECLAINVGQSQKGEDVVRTSWQTFMPTGRSDNPPFRVSIVLELSASWPASLERSMSD